MIGISLYNIEAALLELAQAREELVAEVHSNSPDFLRIQEATAELAEVDKAIAEYAGSREPAKVDSIHGLLQTWRICAEVARQDAREAEARAQRLEANKKRLEQMVLDVMSATCRKRLDGTGGRYLSRRTSGGLAPLEVQADMLPDNWQDVTVKMPLTFWRQLRDLHPEQMPGMGCVTVSAPEPSNTRIRLGLQVGPIPGARLGARGETLQVR